MFMYIHVCCWLTRTFTCVGCFTQPGQLGVMVIGGNLFCFQFVLVSCGMACSHRLANCWFVQYTCLYSLAMVLGAQLFVGSCLALQHSLL